MKEVYRITWTCQPYSGVQVQIAETPQAARAAVVKSVARRLSVPPVIITAEAVKQTWQPSYDKYIGDWRHYNYPSRRAKAARP